MNHRQRIWFFIGFLALPALVYGGAATYYSIALWRTPDIEYGFETNLFSVEGGRWPVLEGDKLRVTEVIPGSEADRGGIRKDDVIMAINGQAFTGLKVFIDKVERGNPGDRVIFTIRHSEDQTSFDVPVTLAAAPGEKGPGELGFLIFSNTWRIVCIGVGLGVLLLRAEGGHAFTLCLLLLSWAAIGGQNLVEFKWSPGFRELAMGFKGIFIPLALPLFYFFFARFPKPSPIERWFPWLKYVLLTPAAVIGSFDALVFLTGLHSLSLTGSLLQHFLSLRTLHLMSIVFLLGLPLGLLSLILSMVKAPSEEDRRTLRITLWSLAGGLGLPIVLGILLFALVGNRLWRLDFPLVSLLPIPVLTLPFSFAYAVMQHRPTSSPQ
jgi:hypothetical protein